MNRRPPVIKGRKPMKQYLKTNELTIHFSAIYVLVFAGYCAINGFPMVFLVNKGFSYVQIGIIMSSVNLFSALIQPFYPKLLALFKNMTLRSLTAAVSAAAALVSAAMLFIPNSFGFYWISYVLISITEVGCQALVNSLAMQFMNRGNKLDYGIARGASSAGYALCAFIFGILLEKYGIVFLVPLNIVIQILLIFCILILKTPDKYYKIRDVSEEYDEDPAAPNANVISFVLSYKMFSVFLLSVLIVYIGNCLMGGSFAPNMVGQFNGTTKDAGNLVSVISIFEMVPMLIYSRISDRLSISTLVLICASGFLGRALGSYFSQSLTALTLTQIFQITGHGLFSIVSVYFANKQVRDSDRILGQGLIYGAVCVGNMIANFLSGPLLENHGVHGMLFFCLVTVVIGSALMAFSVVKMRSD